MSMTLWPSRKDLQREVFLQDASEILAERLWLPVYEDGGIDALVEEGLVAQPPPSRSHLPNPGSPVK